MNYISFRSINNYVNIRTYTLFQISDSNKLLFIIKIKKKNYSHQLLLLVKNYVYLFILKL